MSPHNLEHCLLIVWNFRFIWRKSKNLIYPQYFQFVRMKWKALQNVDNIFELNEIVLIDYVFFMLVSLFSQLFDKREEVLCHRLMTYLVHYKKCPDWSQSIGNHYWHWQFKYAWDSIPNYSFDTNITFNDIFVYTRKELCAWISLRVVHQLFHFVLSSQSLNYSFFYYGPRCTVQSSRVR